MRRLITPLVALCLAGSLAACGSDTAGDTTEPDQAPTSAAESAPAESATPAQTATEAETSASPEAEETPAETETSAGSDVAEAEMLPIPAEGPGTITEFPVPAGSKLNDFGGFSGQWQFTILTNDPQPALDFYAAVLPELGYTVVENPTTSAGENVIEWDLGFEGPAFGTIRWSQGLGGIDVIVGDEKFTD